MPTGPIIKEGFPLIGAMLIITVVLGYLGHYVIAIISFILALFFVNFFRNPKRVIPQDPDLILSPADGKIILMVKLRTVTIRWVVSYQHSKMM